MRYLYTLLVLIPVALVLDRLHAPAAWVFGASALAILPLSAVMGRATEALAERTGPTVGGLLNATMGNAAELIITVFALQAGLIDLVKASLTGSILGNLLLILGLSIFVGGLRHPVQTFSARAAGMSVAHMMLAIIALGFPALFALTHPERAARVQQIELSLAVAGVLILVYGAGLVFTLVTHRSLVAPPVGEAGAAGEQHWGARRALVLLVLSTVGVAFMSELLVHATEEAIASLGLTELFVGVIVIPLIGNAAEHTAAVWMAAKNKMTWPSASPSARVPRSPSSSPPSSSSLPWPSAARWTSSSPASRSPPSPWRAASSPSSRSTASPTGSRASSSLPSTPLSA